MIIINFNDIVRQGETINYERAIMNTGGTIMNTRDIIMNTETQL